MDGASGEESSKNVYLRVSAKEETSRLAFPAGVCYASPMKSLLPLLFAACLPLRAEIRTFKNDKGVEIKAELVSATPTHAELKREDGKKYTVPIRTLSEADQKWIAEWAKTHKHFKLQVAATVKKGNTREAEGDGFSEKTKGNDCWYDIALKNTAAEPLAGVRVEYIAFAPSGASTCGASDVNTIPSGKAGQVLTGKLFVPQAANTVRTSSAGGSASITRYSESSLAGLHAELFLNGKPSGTIVNGKVPADAAAQLQAWRDKQPKPSAAETKPEAAPKQ